MGLQNVNETEFTIKAQYININQEQSLISKNDATRISSDTKHSSRFNLLINFRIIVCININNNIVRQTSLCSKYKGMNAQNIIDFIYNNHNGPILMKHHPFSWLIPFTINFYWQLSEMLNQI